MESTGRIGGRTVETGNVGGLTSGIIGGRIDGLIADRIGEFI